MGALDTDLYQLTMLQGYFTSGRAEQEVVFDLFFRRIPFKGGFCLTAGLEQVIDYLTNLHFTKRDIAYLRKLGIFSEEFLNYLLKEWRFRCDVAAMPEGTLIFPNEPMVRVSGPIISAQLVESALLHIINYQTLVATRAARLCIAAAGDPVVDFGLRRAPSFSGVMAARAAFIGGVAGTSNVEAARILKIPVKGTHAHSWIQSFPTEFEAFAAYARAFPDGLLLLVDTYDTLSSGVPNAISTSKQVLGDGKRLKGIRIDSGDLNYMSREAWKIMQKAGCTEAKIVASNDLDEFLIEDLKKQGAKINIWGVGTKLVHPPEALGGVYKLVVAEFDGKLCPVIKISGNPEKTTIPGFKEIYRVYGKDDMFLADILALADEKIDDLEEIELRHPNIHYKLDKLVDFSRVDKLLVPIFNRHQGLIYRSPKLIKIREHAQKQLATLPSEHKRFINPHIYRVGLTSKLFSLREKLIQEKVRQKEAK
jgi:nicotinate phosphoribosyltransferase